MLQVIRSAGTQLQPRTFNMCGLSRILYSTGIEHAEAMKEVGTKKNVDPKVYKCSEYFNFHKHSFYDKEMDMLSSRMPQPSNKKPDAEPKAKP